MFKSITRQAGVTSRQTHTHTHTDSILTSLYEQLGQLSWKYLGFCGLDSTDPLHGLCPL